MATKNYHIKVKEFEDFPDCIVYDKFKEKFEKNLVETYKDLKHSAYFNKADVGHYDINDTAVLIRSDSLFRLKGDEEYHIGICNMRITGLEKNIKQAEDKIKSKGFALAKLDNR